MAGGDAGSLRVGGHHQSRPVWRLRQRGCLRSRTGDRIRSRLLRRLTHLRGSVKAPHHLGYKLVPGKDSARLFNSAFRASRVAGNRPRLADHGGGKNTRPGISRSIRSARPTWPAAWAICTCSWEPATAGKEGVDCPLGPTPRNDQLQTGLPGVFTICHWRALPKGPVGRACVEGGFRSTTLLGNEFPARPVGRATVKKCDEGRLAAVASGPEDRARPDRPGKNHGRARGEPPTGSPLNE